MAEKKLNADVEDPELDVFDYEDIEDEDEDEDDDDDDEDEDDEDADE